MIINTGLEVIIAFTSSVFFAQSLKVLFYCIMHKSLDFKILTHTGGMPSSHSAFSMAIATSVGLIKGFSSVECAISLGFAMIVMYDAAGLRRSAGKMATVLNRLVDDIYLGKNPKFPHEKLRELLGHTPIEVLMGALMGTATAFIVHMFLLSN